MSHREKIVLIIDNNLGDEVRNIERVLEAEEDGGEGRDSVFLILQTPEKL